MGPPPRRRTLATLAALAGLLTGCGGDDAASISPTGTATSTTSTAGTCSLLDRQNWASAQLREWYLFPETLPATLDPSPYASVGDYVDALTATARAQGRDRYFTYLTTISSETAYYDAGTSAGFGFRLTVDATARRAFVAESFEGCCQSNANPSPHDKVRALGVRLSSRGSATPPGRRSVVACRFGGLRDGVRG